MDDRLISPEYLSLISRKHEKKPWGGKGHTWAHVVAPLLNPLIAGAKVLDFGCGTGTFVRAMKLLRPDLEYYEYDPGVAGKNIFDWHPVDYVVCTDVMEHVEEDKVEFTLRTIDYIARQGVFFNIDLAVSTSLLPDGRSTHITVKPREWWLSQLDENLRFMKWTEHKSGDTQLVISGWRTWGVE